LTIALFYQGVIHTSEIVSQVAKFGTTIIVTGQSFKSEDSPNTTFGKAVGVFALCSACEYVEDLIPNFKGLTAATGLGLVAGQAKANNTGQSACVIQ